MSVTLAPRYTTVDEVWTETLTDTYAAACAFALAHLGPGPGRLLVIGSPLGEARRLAAAGWTTHYLDWRPAPAMPGVTVHQGDARSLPWPTGAFDAVASTCVLCHVGMGRYGDPVGPDGPGRMLREVYRVLAPGGRFALTVGPVTDGQPEERLEHRVTTLAQVEAWCQAAGLVPIAWTVWTDTTGQDYGAVAGLAA